LSEQILSNAIDITIKQNQSHVKFITRIS